MVYEITTTASIWIPGLGHRQEYDKVV